MTTLGSDHAAVPTKEPRQNMILKRVQLKEANGAEQSCPSNSQLRFIDGSKAGFGLNCESARMAKPPWGNAGLAFMPANISRVKLPWTCLHAGSGTTPVDCFNNTKPQEGSNSGTHTALCSETWAFAQRIL